MQSEYAKCMVKLKSFDLVVDRGCLHVNVEENGAFNCQENIWLFSSYITAFINIFKLIKI